MNYIGGYNFYRYFKVISVNNKQIVHSGRYSSKKYPQTAAKKAFTQLSKKYKTNKLTFYIKETTQGSLKKEYGPYLVQKVKLKKPLTVIYKTNNGKNKIVLKKYKTKIHLVKDHKKKGGIGETGLYGHLRRKNINSQLYREIANSINSKEITTTNQINSKIQNKIKKKLSNSPVSAKSFTPRLNNIDEKLVEQKLLEKLNLRSLMKSRTSKQRKELVNEMLRNENSLKKIFEETAQNDEEYIKRLYLKLLSNQNIPFLQSKNNQATFLRVMKEVMDEKGIVASEYLAKWNEWCRGRNLPELSFKFGGSESEKDCSGTTCTSGPDEHIFNFNNLQVGNRYHFERGNVFGIIIRREDITCEDILIFSDSNRFEIRMLFNNEEYYISMRYLIPDTREKEKEKNRKISWDTINNIRGHISVFRPL